jgi:SAM-dependent methyltransferase
MTPNDLLPSEEEMRSFVRAKYVRKGQMGWGPQLQSRFDYVSPEDFYEATVSKLVTPGCVWADVGCGRDIFPHNPQLAAEVARRCEFLYGIDPDANIEDNVLINDGFRGPVEDCNTTRRFDLITLRMVAEHIAEPERAVAKVSDLLKIGGLAIVYTPNKWAPVSLAAAAIPWRLHHPLKRLLWDVEARDSFPTVYKMNTESALRDYFRRNGLEEARFLYLDDCRTFSRYRLLLHTELLLRTMLKRIGLRYPETCLLGIYQKTQDRT